MSFFDRNPASRQARTLSLAGDGRGSVLHRGRRVGAGAARRARLGLRQHESDAVVRRGWDEVHAARLRTLLHAQRHDQLLRARGLVSRRSSGDAADRCERPRSRRHLGVQHVPLPERAGPSRERGHRRSRQGLLRAADPRLQERVAPQYRSHENELAVHDRLRRRDVRRGDRAGGGLLQLDAMAAVDRSRRNGHGTEDPRRGRRASAARRARRRPRADQATHRRNAEKRGVQRDPAQSARRLDRVRARRLDRARRSAGEWARSRSGMHDLPRGVARRACSRADAARPLSELPRAAARRLQVRSAARRLVGADGAGRGELEAPKTS